MRQTPRIVATSMPEKTASPITFLASAPAPDAMTSGTTPRMKAKAVMRMGRKRSWAAPRAASARGCPSWNFMRANSTMRMAFLAARPMSMTRPIWAKTLLT
jgi:hypothetical protein